MIKVQDAGNKYVITRKGMIVNCGLFDSFEEAMGTIRESIFRDEIDSFTVVTFRQYVDAVEP